MWMDLSRTCTLSYPLSIQVLYMLVMVKMLPWSCCCCCCCWSLSLHWCGCVESERNFGERRQRCFCACGCWCWQRWTLPGPAWPSARWCCSCWEEEDPKIYPLSCCCCCCCCCCFACPGGLLLFLYNVSCFSCRIRGCCESQRRRKEHEHQYEERVITGRSSVFVVVVGVTGAILRGQRSVQSGRAVRTGLLLLDDDEKSTNTSTKSV